MTAAPPRISAAVAALAVLASLSAAPAQAALSLSAQASRTFTAVALNGNDRTTTYTVQLTAGDTGPSAGWSISITSTAFSTPGPPASTLDVDASTVTGVAVACVSSCGTTPANSVTYPLGVPAGPTAPPAVTLRNASAGTGTGTWRVTPTIRVDVPANAYKGTYSAVVTTAIASGP